MLTRPEAVRRARRLRARMQGRGWKAQVWENLGWHYAVRNGPMVISPVFEEGPGKKRFSALMTDSLDPGPVGGLPQWTGRASFLDPNSAAREQVRLAYEYFAQIRNVMTYLTVRGLLHPGSIVHVGPFGGLAQKKGSKKGLPFGKRSRNVKV